MSVKIKSVKFMSVNIIIKSGKILVNFNEDFSAISDLRLVDNCLKMTAYDVILIGGNYVSETVILDA